MQKVITLSKFVLFISLSLFSWTSLAEIIQVRVLGVHDGDTITVLDSTKQKAKVRLLGVDTPEVDFEGHSQGVWSERARLRLSEFAVVGQFVRLDVVSMDKHGRILGRIISSDGIDVNKVLLSEGLGVLYFIDPSDKRLLSEYSQAAGTAEQERRGFYREIYSGMLTVPYNFRLQVKNQNGRNWVGDLSNKIIFPSGVQPEILWSQRVYFSDLSIAQSLGYKLIGK